MTASERYAQLLTLVSEYRETAERGFRRLAEKVGSIERSLSGGGRGAAVPERLVTRVDETVRRLEERFSGGADPKCIAEDLRKLVVRVEKLDRHIAVLHAIASQGAQMDFPWFHIRGDRNGHKGKQVMKVWWHLKENPKCCRSRAVEDTFVADPLGYPKLSGLMSACLRLQVDKYRHC